MAFFREGEKGLRPWQTRGVTARPPGPELVATLSTRRGWWPFGPVSCMGRHGRNSAGQTNPQSGDGWISGVSRTWLDERTERGATMRFTPRDQLATPLRFPKLFPIEDGTRAVVTVRDEALLLRPAIRHSLHRWPGILQRRSATKLWRRHGPNTSQSKRNWKGPAIFVARSLTVLTCWRFCGERRVTTRSPPCWKTPAYETPASHDRGQGLRRAQGRHGPVDARSPGFSHTAQRVSPLRPRRSRDSH